MHRTTRLRPRAIHSWAVTPTEAVQIQRALAGRVRRRGSLGAVRLVAGCDAAFSSDGGACVAGVVVWDTRLRSVVEQRVVRGMVRFPYVPGLLSFREIPALFQAVAELRCRPEVFLFDGQGYAHPRRFGLASHAGVLLDRPAVGCAKSILVGACEDPDVARGATAPLTDRGEQIGMAVRTRHGVKPVYVSVGHKVSLAAAVRLVLQCCTGFRLPEPIRLADRLVAAEKARTA